MRPRITRRRAARSSSDSVDATPSLCRHSARHVSVPSRETSEAAHDALHFLVSVDADSQRSVRHNAVVAVVDPYDAHQMLAVAIIA